MSNQNLSLSENHLKILSDESGISEQMIRERGYRTITSEGDLVQFGFSPAQRRVPGLLIPLYTTDGKIGLHVYRPDNPRTYENRSKREAGEMPDEPSVKAPKDFDVRAFA